MKWVFAYAAFVLFLIISFAVWACPFWFLKVIFALLLPPVGWMIYDSATDKC